MTTKHIEALENIKEYKNKSADLKNYNEMIYIATQALTPQECDVKTLDN